MPINFFPILVGILVKALETDWAVLAEEIGVWIPSEIFNREHDDKPEDADEFGKFLRLLRATFCAPYLLISSS